MNENELQNFATLKITPEIQKYIQIKDSQISTTVVWQELPYIHIGLVSIQKITKTITLIVLVVILIKFYSVNYPNQYFIIIIRITI